MTKTKWYAKPVYVLVALTLVLSLGIVALPMAGTVEADEGMIYAITDLGHLGGDYSQAQDINNLGQVVGSTKVADGSYTTFRWSESGGMIDLGTFGGRYGNCARGINGSGQVVGESTKADGKSHAFIYDDNGMRDINDLLPGGSGWILTKAYDINDAGQVVGEGIISGATHAFLWSESEGVTDLGTLSGYSDSTARGINNSGQVVGWSGTKGGPPIWQLSHAFLWSESEGMTSLGDLGGDWSQAHAINNPAQVVGQSKNTDEDCHAFLWSAGGGMTDLGPSGGWSYAYDINSSAQIVGSMKPAGGSYTAFLHDGTNGMQDINGLIPEGTGWTLNIAYGINDASQIVGGMLDESYTTHAYLLTSRSRPEEVWVDGDWDGTTLGTEVETGKIFGFNAFAAIQGGIDNVAAAGTVNVAEGTYNENVNVEVEHLTIQSLDGAASTTLTAPIKSDYVFDIEADSVTIDGFTFGNFALGVRVNANNCIIKNNVVSGSTGAYVVPLVDEDFEGGTLPTDWKRTSNGAGWLIGEELWSWGFYIPPHTTYAASNDDAAGGANDGSVDYLITPPLDLSDCSSADLSFQSFYNGWSGQLAYVEISEDGGSSWEELKQITAHGNWTQVDVDLSTYCGTGHNSVLVAFHSNDGGGSGSGWAIDDVLITTEPPNMPVDGAIIVNGNSNTIQGNTISSNGCPGIYLEGSSTDNEIHFNNIEGNTDYGINNTASSIVDATNNWWGDASGPYDPTGSDPVPPCDDDPTDDLNDDGLGDKVSDNVDYCPWLKAPFQVYELLDDLKAEIRGLPDGAFNNAKASAGQQKALLNKVDALSKQIEAGAYQGAINKLQNDVRDKIEKWIEEPYQSELIEKVDAAIEILEGLLE